MHGSGPTLRSSLHIPRARRLPTFTRARTPFKPDVRSPRSAPLHKLMNPPPAAPGLALTRVSSWPDPARPSACPPWPSCSSPLASASTAARRRLRPAGRVSGCAGAARESPIGPGAGPVTIRGADPSRMDPSRMDPSRIAPRRDCCCGGSGSAARARLAGFTRVAQARVVPGCPGHVSPRLTVRRAQALTPSPKRPVRLRVKSPSR